MMVMCILRKFKASVLIMKESNVKDNRSAVFFLSSCVDFSKLRCGLPFSNYIFYRT